MGVNKKLNLRWYGYYAAIIYDDNRNIIINTTVSQSEAMVESDRPFEAMLREQWIRSDVHGCNNEVWKLCF